MQDGESVYEQVPVPDLQPQRHAPLDRALIEALKPGAVVEVSSGSTGARHIVRAVVLANVLVPAEPLAGFDSYHPCQDDEGVMHWDLLPLGGLAQVSPWCMQ